LNFIGHSQGTTIPYNANPYTFNPKMHQLAGTGAGPATNNIYSGYGADEFVNFTFDTGSKNVYLVYTTNGSDPNKSNGSVVTCGFSTYNEPDRLWRCQIPSGANTTGANLKYIFYISDSDLASAWGRIDGFGGNQYLTSWNEGIVTAYSYTVIDNALPVNLISFDSEVTNNQSVKLTWTTASETNNQYFDIQRSTNGKDFTMIGRVNGKGNSQETIAYEYTDKQPKNGVNYYRLKQVDFNGKSEYSKIIASKEISGLTKVYPNPVNNILQVNDSQVVSDIKLFDFAGKIFYQNTVKKDQYDISDVPAGNYILLIRKLDNSVYTERIIKK